MLRFVARLGALFKHLEIHLEDVEAFDIVSEWSDPSDEQGVGALDQCQFVSMISQILKKEELIRHVQNDFAQLCNIGNRSAMDEGGSPGEALHMYSNDQFVGPEQVSNGRWNVPPKPSVVFLSLPGICDGKRAVEAYIAGGCTRNGV